MLYTNNSNRGRISGGVVYAVIKAALLAASLDILVAMIHYYLKTGKNVLLVLKFIASAVYGKEAFGGGNSMAVIGLVFHCMIALCWTIFFFILYPRISLLRKNNIITGLLYGIFIWLIMNLLILPMSNIPSSTFKIVPAITGAVILMVAIGLPVAIMADKYYSKQVKN